MPEASKKETFRVGKKAARAIIMNLLADLIKKIIQKFISWLKTGNKSIKALVVAIKDAIIDFVLDLKTHVVSVLDTAVTVIASSIIGPVVGVIKRALMLIKQGWRSLKEAIAYVRDPQNKYKPIGIMMMEIGKIIMAGLTASGAIVLSEVIEDGLLAIPLFAVEIPFLGSLANVIGVFMGAVIAGIIGALIIDLINRMIGKKQKVILSSEKIDKANEVLSIQKDLMNLNIKKTSSIKNSVIMSIQTRHKEAEIRIKESSLNQIVLILVYLVQGSCNTRTTVPQLSGHWFY